MRADQALLEIPYGHAGTARTVAAIFAMAYNPYTTRFIRDHTLKVCKRAHSKRAQAKAIFDWAHDNIDYRRDPLYREWVSDPAWVIEQAKQRSHQAAEDCDGFTALILAMGGSIGLEGGVNLLEDPTYMGPPETPYWIHVYADLKTENGPEPCDASLKWLPFGVKNPGRTTRLTVDDFPLQAWVDAQAFSADGLGFATQFISAGSQIAQSAITSNAMKKAAAEQTKWQTALLQSQENLAKYEQNLEFQAAALEAERIARIQQELAVFEELDRRVQAQNRKTLIVGGVVAALAAAAYYLNTRRSR